MWWIKQSLIINFKYPECSDDVHVIEEKAIKRREKQTRVPILGHLILDHLKCSEIGYIVAFSIIILCFLINKLWLFHIQHFPWRVIFPGVNPIEIYSCC